MQAQCLAVTARGQPSWQEPVAELLSRPPRQRRSPTRQRQPGLQSIPPVRVQSQPELLALRHLEERARRQFQPVCRVRRFRVQRQYC